jgi:hypothetical protein
MFEATVINEAGYDEAMLGLSLSYGSSKIRSEQIAPNLAHKDGGHNKFLESIYVWLKVDAPRYWWQEADTYRMSSKQSESTMHTISKRPLGQCDFVAPIPEDLLRYLNTLIEANDFTTLKRLLPESYMQLRIWCLSYKTLKNIINQRKNHRLVEWKIFVKSVLKEVNNPEFLTKGEIE